MKKLLIASTASILVVGLGSHLALNRANATDVPPIVQQVQHQQEELDNHDARIGNNENDIKDLQNKTGTPPSSNNVTAPQITTPSISNTQLASPTPTPAAQSSGPITVVSSTYIMDLSGNNHCQLTYSDGSTDSRQAHLTYTQNGNTNSSQDDCAQYVGQVK